MTCETCRWSEFDYVSASTFGLRCKRFPPNAVLFPETPVQIEHFQSVWPVMQPDDWCGEYQAKAETPHD